MVDMRNTHWVLAAAIGAALLLPSCGSGVGDAAPRIATIPVQTANGGTTFDLDLSVYVTDRENDPLIYVVDSGGGNFAGTTYTNTFATMGTYTVAFTVSGGGKSTQGSFVVNVTSGTFAAVREETTGLLLLDTDTEKFVRITANTSTASFATAFGDGKLVYHLAVGGQNHMWVFDPFTRSNTRIGDELVGSVDFRTATSTELMVFTATSGLDSNLYTWNPLNSLVREVSAADGEFDGNPMVNGSDLVFYERGNGGQRDIYYYDPDSDTSTAVSIHPTDERLQTVLANGAVVFSRVGGNGETDLFYFKQGTGTVEVGGDVSALDVLDKGWQGQGSGSQVVFSVSNGPNTELYEWNPAGGASTAIATLGTAAFEAVTDSDEVVWRDEVSGADHDLHLFDLTDSSTATILDSGDVLTFRAVTHDGTDSFVVFEDATNAARIYVYNTTSAVTTQINAGGAVDWTANLGNGDFVFSRGDGLAVAVFDLSALTTSFTANGTAVTFAGGGTADGDFLYTMTAAAQVDLSMFDASAPGAMVVSNTAGDDAFGAMTSAGEVLFTRTDAEGHDQLYLWDPVDTTTEQLTFNDAVGNGFDHRVLGTWSGTRL